MKRISIKNTSGREVGFFTYDPDDPMLLLRFEHLRSVLLTICKELDRFDYSPDGRTTGGRKTRQLQKLERRLCDAIDYFLGSASSKHLFGEIKPFAALKTGRFWFDHVVTAILETVFPDMNEAEKREKIEQ